MTRQELFGLIKTDLPNFPDDVITDWLLPYAERMGWPPTGSRWAAILPNGIGFWKNVKWEQKKITIDVPLTVPAASAIMGMHASYNLKQDNAYAQIDNGNERYMSAVKHFAETGKLPKPIVLLKQPGGLHDIMDGSHRYLAWNATVKLHKELQQVDDERRRAFLDKIKTGWGITNVAALQPTQDAWIGCHESS